MRDADRTRWTAAVALFLASCTGAIADGDAVPPMPGAPQPGTQNGAAASKATPSTTTTATSTTPAASCAPGSRGAARESVRRLSREELRATLSDLLPVAPQVAADIDQVPDGAGNDGWERFLPLHNEAQISQWLAVADKVGALVAGDAKLRAAVGSDPCLATATVTSACWHTVLPGFLRRAFRRPATAAEVDRYAAPVAGKDAATGLQSVVMRVLLAPEFMFHIETGASADATRVRLGAYEVANRVSYAVTGSAPDAQLAAAADAGQLGTLAQVEAQVRRLMDTPRARQQVQNFFGAWTDVSTMQGPPSKVYTTWAKMPGTIQQATRDLAQDVTDFVGAVVLQDRAGFRELMTRPKSYTRSAALQAIYGVDQAQPAPYATPDHAGLTLRAGFLVDQGLNTNPIERGVRYLKRILCVDLPLPDPAVVAMRDAVTIDPLTMPNYERVTAQTSAPLCTACHSKINPIGFLLESYDTLGRKRAQESYLQDANGTVKVMATHPLPGAVDLTVPGLPARLSSPSELVDAVAGSDQARACMGAFLLRQQQRRKEATADACAIADAATALAGSGAVLEAFVRSVANEDIFWRGV